MFAIISNQRYWVKLKPELRKKLLNLHHYVKFGSKNADAQQSELYAQVKSIEEKSGRRLSYSFGASKDNNGLALVPLLDDIGGKRTVGFWINAVQHLVWAKEIQQQVADTISDLQLWREAVAQQDPSLINKKLNADAVHKARWKGGPVKVQTALWDREEWTSPLEGMDSLGSAFTWFTDMSKHKFFEQTWIPNAKGEKRRRAEAAAKAATA